MRFLSLNVLDPRDLYTNVMSDLPTPPSDSTTPPRFSLFALMIIFLIKGEPLGASAGNFEDMVLTFELRNLSGLEAWGCG